MQDRRERDLLPEGPLRYDDVQLGLDEDALQEQDSTPAAEWVWIDTCCIDKKSSAEISEAVNSMFRWYNNSLECIVHLADVPTWSQVGLSSAFVMDTLQRREPSTRWGDLGPRALNVRDAFDSSAWFGRGWTLQELLAPKTIVFCNARWEVIGHICRDRGTCRHERTLYGIDLTHKISAITRIPRGYLIGEDLLHNASVAQRMSWASRRTTTRPEDEAYCLLGILNVNMPMIYGEGRKAFRRLQQEIIQKSTDQSIFAWTNGTGLLPLLASSPAAFAHAANFRPGGFLHQRPYALTNNGLEMRTKLYKVNGKKLGTEYGDVFLLQLSCVNTRSGRFIIALRMGQCGRYYRILPKNDERWKRFDPTSGTEIGERVIYLDTGNEDILPPAASGDSPPDALS